MPKAQPKPRILVIARENDFDLTKQETAKLDYELKSKSIILVPRKEPEGKEIKSEELGNTELILKEIRSRTLDAILMQTLSVKGLPPGLDKKYGIKGIPDEGELTLPHSYWQGFSLIDYARRQRKPIPVVTAFNLASNLHPFQEAIYAALEKQFGVTKVLDGNCPIEYIAQELKKVIRG